MKKPHAVSWNTIPSPYSIDRFTAIATSDVVEFEAWFSAPKGSDRSWVFSEEDWNFKYRYLKVISIFGHRFALPPLSLLTSPPEVLATYYAGPEYLLGASIAKLRGSRIALWCLLTFESWNRRSWWKERIKKFIFSHADAVLTVGPDSSEYAAHYGASEQKILHVPQAFDFNFFAKHAAELRARSTKRRSELGLSGTVFLYVGRLWKGKGVVWLLDAFRLVQEEYPSASLLIVGDGEDESLLRQYCSDLKLGNVIFAGFVQKSSLPEFYALGDVLVFPTTGDPYGLVVDEALASSIPVISSSAAGEITERVHEKVNGFIVPVNDIQALYLRMKFLVEHEDVRAQMSKAAPDSVSSLTPEQWALDLERAVQRLMWDSKGEHQISDKS